MLQRNLLLVNIYKFFNGLEPLSVFIIIYFYQITGSFATAVAVRSIETITCSLSEIPVGLISDNIGRKKVSVITGLLMTLSAFFWALGGSIDSTVTLFVGGFFAGLANSFYSGSFEALIYETCTKLKRRQDFSAVISNAGTCRYLALALGTIMALVIYSLYGLTVLAWFAVLPRICETITSLFFVEPLANSPKVSSLQMLKNSIKCFKASKKLRQISALQIFDESLYWTNLGINSLYFQTLVPLWVINIATFINHILSALGYAAFKKFRQLNMFKILTFSSWIEAGFGIITIIVNSVLSPFIWGLASFFQYFKRPAKITVIQHELSPHQRATMGSMISLLSGICSGICMYMVGLIADYTSIYVGFSILIGGKIILGYFYSALTHKYAPKK